MGRMKAQMALALDPAASNAALRDRIETEEKRMPSSTETETTAPTPAEPARPPQDRASRRGGKAALSDGGDYKSGRQTLYAVMAFKWGRVRVKKGWREGWQRLPDLSFKGKDRALRTAEEMVEAGRATGAMAFEQSADVDLGDYDEPVVLGRYGFSLRGRCHPLTRNRCRGSDLSPGER